MHAAQAVTVDAASGSHDMLPPATDAGIDLGWDDEQVTLWLNRQLDALRKRLDPLQKAVEAPLGVSGYRVDVRMPDDPLRDAWESLCLAFSIDAAGAKAPLSFPPAPATAVFTGNFEGELTVEPAPAKSVHATDGLSWLPQHFTRWQDGSLVVSDTTLFQLAGTSPRDAGNNNLVVRAADLRCIADGNSTALWQSLRVPLPLRGFDRRRTGHRRPARSIRPNTPIR